MATLTIKNVPEKLVRRLKTQASLHRRSLNLEVIACLESATGATPVDPDALLAIARAIRPTPVGIRLTDRVIEDAINRGRKH
ncbi:MAG TPA: DNA-binding protein [Methylomirabilota bacterium]|jgi:plasmid stability protein